MLPRMAPCQSALPSTPSGLTRISAANGQILGSFRPQYAIVLQRQGSTRCGPVAPLPNIILAISPHKIFRHIGAFLPVRSLHWADARRDGVSSISRGQAAQKSKNIPTFWAIW